MGVKMKQVKDQEPEKEVVKIPYYMLQVIAELIGKFRCQTYEEFELIQGKKEALNKELQSLGEKSGNDQGKAQAMWQTGSDLTKTEFAWMEAEAFKALVPGLGLNAEQIGVLNFWVVKD